MVQGPCHGAPIERRHRPRALAPEWHTALLVLLILLVALGGLLGIEAEVRAVRGESLVVGSYLPLCAVAASLAAYVSYAWPYGSLFSSLWGKRARGEIARDALVAAALFAVVLGVERVLQSSSPASSSALLPHTPAERLAWALTATLVGWSEELVYRGYLRRQLAAYCASDGLGNVAQALLFGVAHLEQGLGAALRIAGYGLLFGAVVRNRRHLLPAVLCHVALNLYAGLG
jgi:uncharacterized protein